jgi:hypothetical protein
MEEVRNTGKTLVGAVLKGRNHSEDLGVEKNKILRRNLRRFIFIYSEFLWTNSKGMHIQYNVITPTHHSPI